MRPMELSKGIFPKLKFDQVSPTALPNWPWRLGDFPLTLLRLEQSNLNPGLQISQVWVCILGGPFGDCVVLDESHHLPELFPHLGSKAAMTFIKEDPMGKMAPGWGHAECPAQSSLSTWH